MRGWRDGRACRDSGRCRNAEVVGFGLAARQDGVVTRAQLLELGFTRRSLGRRLERGLFTVLFRGVYAVGHPAIGERGWMRAATFAVPGSLLSHASAARVGELAPRLVRPIELTVVGRHVRSRPGLRLHVVNALHPLDAGRSQGLPLTSPARTLLDLAARLPPDVLQRAITEARVKRLVEDGDLEATIARASQQHAGARRLEAALGATGAEPTRSALERAFLRLVDAAGLPRPEVNRRCGPHVIDFTWPRERVIVETDGWAAHGTRHAFEDDRARDADRQARGFAVLRFTWRQVTTEPARVVALVARTLAVRS